MAVEVKCRKHPQYKGKMPPRAHCKYCEYIFALLHHQHGPDKHGVAPTTRHPYQQTAIEGVDCCFRCGGSKSAPQHR